MEDTSSPHRLLDHPWVSLGACAIWQGDWGLRNVLLRRCFTNSYKSFRSKEDWGAKRHHQCSTFIEMQSFLWQFFLLAPSTVRGEGSMGTRAISEHITLSPQTHWGSPHCFLVSDNPHLPIVSLIGLLDRGSLKTPSTSSSLPQRKHNPTTRDQILKMRKQTPHNLSKRLLVPGEAIRQEACRTSVQRGT